MTTYNVMQHRGCGIEYEVFNGTFEECADYLCKVANVPEEVVYPYCNTHYTATDPEEVNGDGQPYDYYIKRG